MKAALCSALALIVATCATPTVGQAQTGYYETKPVPLPDALRETYHAGAFVIEIDRAIPGREERALVEAAESVFPIRETVDRAIASQWPAGLGEVPSSALEAQRRAAALPGDRWRWSTGSWFHTPFAVTGSAVEHYVERMRALAADPSLYGSAANGSGRVRYVARVFDRTDEREVRLDLQVSLYCGGRCGIEFTHKRSVYFDKAGKIIRVEGDRKPSVVVS